MFSNFGQGFSLQEEYQQFEGSSSYCLFESNIIQPKDQDQILNSTRIKTFEIQEPTMVSRGLVVHDHHEVNIV
jgi:hypothetical protein